MTTLRAILFSHRLASARVLFDLTVAGSLWSLWALTPAPTEALEGALSGPGDPRGLYAGLAFTVTAGLVLVDSVESALPLWLTLTAWGLLISCGQMPAASAAGFLASLSLLVRIGMGAAGGRSGRR